MRHSYPVFDAKTLLTDLIEDRYPLTEKQHKDLTTFLTSSASDKPEQFRLGLTLPNKTVGSVAISRAENLFKVQIAGHNPAKSISYVYDAKHFPRTPNYPQLANYLNGAAILVNRLGKDGVEGEYFIQPIPEKFDRSQIKHLQLHPKQTYLMVSNKYMKMAPQSDSFKIGGRTINQKEYQSIREGNTVEMINPWFFVPNKTQPGQLEKIQIYGIFSFAVDLFKKNYKLIEKVAPAIVPGNLTQSIVDFTSTVKELIGTKQFESKITEAMQNSAVSTAKDWYNLFSHILYYANTRYVKDENKNNHYTYPYQYGYELDVDLVNKSITMFPSGSSIESEAALKITDPVAVLNALQQSQQISETLCQQVTEVITESETKGQKI
jgi:hypothetical protein